MTTREHKCLHDFALYWNGKEFIEKCYYCGMSRKRHDRGLISKENNFDKKYIFKMGILFTLVYLFSVGSSAVETGLKEGGLVFMIERGWVLMSLVFVALCFYCLILIEKKI